MTTDATGPQGERGARGERGQQGSARLPGQQARAIVVLFIVCVVLTVASILFTIHFVDANNHKFCAVVTGLTVQAPAPSDPAANPSREHQYVEYLKAVRLARDLGCSK